MFQMIIDAHLIMIRYADDYDGYHDSYDYHGY